MKKNNLFIFCLFLGIISINIATARTKVACVGNSITGFHQYPYYATPLRQMLGDEYLVDNFGKGGSGVFKQYREELNEHQWAYINSTECEAALAFNPDIVIIKFGANDANMNNFTKKDIDGKQRFKDEYTLLIDKFRDLPTNPQVFICIPPAMFYPNGNLKDSLTGNFLGGFNNQAMTQYIHPAVKELAVELNIGLVDFYTPTKMHPEYMPGESKDGGFPDWVHPDHRGHYVMALAAYEAIKGKPFERPEVVGEFIPDPEKEYYIRNRANGKVLTCDSEKVNTALTLENMEIGAAKQLFTFENFSYNIYRIRHTKSELQLKNAGASVIIGNDAGSQGTKYGMLITPIEEGYHAIGIDDRNYIGGSSTNNTVAGNKNGRRIGEIDHWEFIEKGEENQAGLSDAVAYDNRVIGGKGKILFNNLNEIKDLVIYNLVGNVIKKYKVNNSAFAIDINPGVYLVSLDDKSNSKIIVR